MIPREKGECLCQFLPYGDCLPKRTAKDITILGGLIDYEECQKEGVQISMVRVNLVLTRAQARVKRSEKGYERRRMLARQRRDETVEVEVAPNPMFQGSEDEGRLPAILTEGTPAVGGGMREDLIAKGKRGHPRGPRVIPAVTRRSTRLQERLPTTIESEPELAVEQHCVPEGVPEEVGEEIDEVGETEVMPYVDRSDNPWVSEDFTLFFLNNGTE